MAITDEKFFKNALVFSPSPEYVNSYDIILDGMVFILSQLLTKSDGSDFKALSEETAISRTKMILEELDVKFNETFMEHYRKMDNDRFKKFENIVKKVGGSYEIEHEKIRTKGDLAFTMFMVVSALFIDRNTGDFLPIVDEDPINNLKYFISKAKPVIRYRPWKECPRFIRYHLKVLDRTGQMYPYR